MKILNLFLKNIKHFLNLLKKYMISYLDINNASYLVKNIFNELGDNFKVPTNFFDQKSEGKSI
jgi:hypothetical protein